jgi:hypothetical protein
MLLMLLMLLVLLLMLLLMLLIILLMLLMLLLTLLRLQMLLALPLTHLRGGLQLQQKLLLLRVGAHACEAVEQQLAVAPPQAQ